MFQLSPHSHTSEGVFLFGVSRPGPSTTKAYLRCAGWRTEGSQNTGMWHTSSVNHPIQFERAPKSMGERETQTHTVFTSTRRSATSDNTERPATN